VHHLQSVCVRGLSAVECWCIDIYGLFLQMYKGSCMHAYTACLCIYAARLHEYTALLNYGRWFYCLYIYGSFADIYGSFDVSTNQHDGTLTKTRSSLLTI